MAKKTNMMRKEYMKQYRADNLDKIKARREQWLIDNPEYHKQYHADNKEKRNAYSKQYFTDNPEKCKAYNKQWLIDNPEKRREYHKQYRADNKEKRSAYDKQYFIDNPDKCSEKNHKRRATARNAFVETVAVKMLFEREMGCCRICNRKLNLATKHPNPLSASIDHIVPLSEGGEHSYKNTQLACLECNIRKGNRTLPGGEQLFMFGEIGSLA